MKMSKQIINGQEFDVHDDGAVRYDEVQELTREEMAQVRKNIDAMREGYPGTDIHMGDHNIDGVGTVFFRQPDETAEFDIGLCYSGNEPMGDRVYAVMQLYDNWDIDLPVDIVLRGLSSGINDNDAATVGQVKDAVKFVRLAETVLTEDATEIMWTQGENGEKLSDYKDFFIYWVGKFDTDTSTGEAWICRANGGIMYYGYTFLNKYTTRQGFWWHIEELLSDNGYTIWKTTFPNAMIGNYTTDFDYHNQGLSDASQQLKGNLTCMESTNKIEHLRFGSLSTGAKMVAGSKAVLYGRKR